MRQNMHIKPITIDGRAIGPGHPPYVIAELSANHNGDLETAFQLITAAKSAGADAVKLQTYRPDTITLNSSRPDFQITDGLWKGRTLYELYEWAHTPWEWHEPLFDKAREVGITLFSSPFDASAIELLSSLDAPAYKIASFEAIDTPLIRRAAATGKPLIISTGMADHDEIAAAIAAARDGGCTELAVLHCVSGYPAPTEDYNLRTLADMIDRFGTVTGLSDHTTGHTAAIASVALGGSLIEKHLTLDRNGGGPDDSFSVEPEELADLCREVKSAWKALGAIDYGRKSSERANARFRRSLYFVADLKAGERIDANSIRSIRPGFGVPPSRFDDVVGRRVTYDVGMGTPVTEDVLADR